jgi:hypothetical protein
MVISGFLEIFLFGMFGGILGELLKWYNLRESKFLPHYLKSPFYWCITFLIILSGGLLASLYGLDSKSALLVVNIGLSSPLLIQTMSRITLKNNPSKDLKVFEYEKSLISIFKKINSEKIFCFLSGIPKPK